MSRKSHHVDAQQPATGPSDAVPIDHDVLGRLLCDDREAVAVVLRQFHSSCSEDASALGAALARNENKDVLRWAHRLEGACRMVGATLLADACERAASAVRAGDAQRAAVAVADIGRETARITEYLGAWLKVNS